MIKLQSDSEDPSSLLLLLSAVIRDGGGGERLHGHGDRGHDHRAADDPDPGEVLGVVLTDRANLGRCLLLLVTGAAAVVAMSWLLGHLVPYPVTAATNSQVAGRVTPRLVDLVAALATGSVGSVALAVLGVRRADASSSGAPASRVRLGDGGRHRSQLIA